MDNIKLLDAQIVGTIVPAFMADRDTANRTYEPKSLVYNIARDVKNGEVVVGVSIGRIKNVRSSANTQSVNSIAADFGLASDPASIKDYLLLRSRLEFKEADFNQMVTAGLICEVGKPFGTATKQYELIEIMNTSGLGEPVLTEDRGTHAKMQRTSLTTDGKELKVFRQIFVKPVGTAECVNLPLYGKIAVANQVQVGSALASAIEATMASATAAAVEASV